MIRSNELYLDARSKKLYAYLDHAEQGRLTMALLDYAEDRRMPEGLTPEGRMAFSIIQGWLDEAWAAWERCRRQNAINGAKGGRPRKSQPEEAKAPLEHSTAMGAWETEANATEEVAFEDIPREYTEPRRQRAIAYAHRQGISEEQVLKRWWQKDRKNFRRQPEQSPFSLDSLAPDDPFAIALSRGFRERLED